MDGLGEIALMPGQQVVAKMGHAMVAVHVPFIALRLNAPVHSVVVAMCIQPVIVMALGHALVQRRLNAMNTLVQTIHAVMRVRAIRIVHLVIGVIRLAVYVRP